jgi:hypothetical protein
MDGGIIKSFKIHYYRAFIKHKIQCLMAIWDHEIDVYKVVNILERDSQEDVTLETIRLCWRHVGFLVHLLYNCMML